MWPSGQGASLLRRCRETPRFESSHARRSKGRGLKTETPIPLYFCFFLLAARARPSRAAGQCWAVTRGRQNASRPLLSHAPVPPTTSPSPLPPPGPGTRNRRAKAAGLSGAKPGGRSGAASFGRTALGGGDHGARRGSPAKGWSGPAKMRSLRARDARRLFLGSMPYTARRSGAPASPAATSSRGVVSFKPPGCPVCHLYFFSSHLRPVKVRAEALTTTTTSPASAAGWYVGLSLPCQKKGGV